MEPMIESIRVAVADGATSEQKAAGAVACRAILAALEAEAGKAIALAGAPAAWPLSGISPDQALDLLIARLSAIAEKQPAPAAPSARPAAAPLRIAFVQPPPRSAAGRRKP
jgi:hypothetical protein